MESSEHCQFFVERKRRFCKMTVKIGSKYCGEHSKVDNNEKNDAKYERIPCPLDNSHTCYTWRLKQHLQVCNAKRLLDSRPDYIVEGINRGDINLPAVQRIPIIYLHQNVIDRVIEKVEAAYENLPKVEELILKHEVLEAEIDNLGTEGNSRKHLVQNSSLLAHLRRAGLLQEDTCFIEFGAGRGKLSYWLAKILADTKNSRIMLVDRSSPRHKRDNKLKNEESSVDIIRIRADIADLSLEKIEGIQQSRHKVGIAKHLCGAATDLTIRCLSHLKDDCDNGIVALLLAFCCHHCCDYVSYVGKEILWNFGFIPEDFPVLCSIASWATCGIFKTEKSDVNNVTSNNSMRSDKRELIGRKVKMLLNWGRIEYLKSIGFSDSQLYLYTKPEISLENMCMVAIRHQVIQ